MDRSSAVTRAATTHSAECAACAVGIMALAAGATLGHAASRGNSLDRPVIASLRAEGHTSTDTDQDGLSAMMEAILMTSDSSQDTDGDGFIDPLEVSFGSDPAQAASRPEGSLLGAVGMCANESTGSLNLATAIYVPGGVLPSIKFTLGVRLGGLMLALPPEVYNSGSTLIEVPIFGTPDKVFVFQATLPVFPLALYGSGSLYSTIAVNSPGAPVIAAAALNLVFHEDTVLELINLPTLSSSSSSSSSGGSLYRPLSPAGDIPTSWTVGQVCVQQTQSVGTAGAVEILQVVSASCQPYDGYCPTSCPNLVGTTVEVVNPLGLIGQ
jgi:hypothetical protein